jgi:hypothetical protein
MVRFDLWVGDGEMGTAGLLGMQEYGIHIEKGL